ncbi:MAG: hypothetical protein AAGK09_00175 [Planctomycetota bacterium]
MEDSLLITVPPDLPAQPPPDLPAPDVRQLAALTDDTGLFQHALYATPDPNHGYCVDDNARALIAAVRLHEHDPALLAGLAAARYLQFVVYAYDDATGRFRNFMGYDRRWLEDVGSTDSQARSLWSVAVAATGYPDPNDRDHMADVFGRAMRGVGAFDSPRSQAFVVLALDAWLGSHPGDAAAEGLLARYADALRDGFAKRASPAWRWFERIVAYDNARLCEALLVAGQRLSRRDLVDVGLSSLRWLIDRQTAEAGHLTVVGNGGWLVPDRPAAKFDQQPLEAHALVDACLSAARVSGDDGWRRAAAWAFAWFHGHNDLGLSLIDPHNGGCRDGLQPAGVNRNQGAESTLAYLGALLAMHADRRGETG